MNRFLTQITGFLLVAAAVFVLVPELRGNIPGVKTNHGDSDDSEEARVLPPDQKYAGNTYAQWSRKWHLWDFSVPLKDNPTANSTAPCTNGQSGTLWFLYGGPPTVNCTVPRGKALFFPVVNTECSNLEPSSSGFHGDTAEQRRACAKAWIDNVTDLFASVDGERVEKLARFRVQTGDFPFSVPADNILGVPGPASGFSSGDGYYLLLPPPSAGVHKIHIRGTFHDPNDPAHPVVFPLDTRLTITIAQ